MLAVPTPSRAAVRRLTAARLVAVTGDVSADVALAVVLYSRTGSAAWVGGALFIAFAVPALVSPLSGAISDRLDRRQVLIAADLLGAACFVGMALVSAPAALLALAFVAALAAAPILPASGSMLPAVTPGAMLPWANSRLAIARTTGQTRRAVHRGRPRRGRRRARLVLRQPTLRALTLGFVLVDIGNGLILPAEVALADEFGAGSVGYGALVAIWGLGGVLGAHLAPRLLDRGDEPPGMTVAAACLALTLAVVAMTPWFAPALGAFALGGAAMAVAGVGEDLLLQRRVADAVRGRVYAAHIAAVQLSLAAPLLVAGALVDALGPQPVFGLAAGAVALGVAALRPLLRA